MFKNIGTDIIKGGIFERFPLLKPYPNENVTENNYWNNNIHSQLLIVGESNYFELEDAKISCFQNAEDWYINAPKECLIPTKELDRKVNNWGKIITASQLKGLYKSLTKVLNADDVAYYNYFLRPALNDKQNNGFEKNYTDLDGKVAFTAFCGILEELKPNLVIFATKLGHDKMESFRKQLDVKFENIVIERVSHPACSWWNANNGSYGRQKFEDLLTEYWIKEKPAYYHNFEKLRYIHQQLKQIFNVEKEPECFLENNLYFSKLDFQIKGCRFSCQTEIGKNNSIYYTYLYDKSSIIPQSILKANNFEFAPDTKNEVVIAEIEKLIRKVIEELS